MDLLNKLTEELGITGTQAEGGVGLILQQLKERLDTGDFAQLTQALPQADALMEKAPGAEGGGLMGAIGGIAKSLGVGDLGNLAGLAEGFKKLGLDADMIVAFVPKILEWAQNAGGPQLKAILEKALK